MSFLLDTHYIIWSLTDTKKIPEKIRSILVDPSQFILVSTVSFWEISLKSSLGKLELSVMTPQDVPDLCLNIGFDIIDLSPADSSTYHLLKAKHHRDPFDRMLIWQAIRNNLTLISSDDIVKKYASEGLKIFY
jgi:PIN domain nuclease of toxin-antitoxin system